MKKVYQKIVFLLMVVALIAIIAIWSHVRFIDQSHNILSRSHTDNTVSAKLYQATKLKNPNIVRVLSLDGGGVRGIVTLEVLKYLEEKTGKSISQLFDVFAGTSTGAIIETALLSPNANNKPKFSVNDLLNQYQQQSEIIFSSSFVHKLFTFDGLFGPKYTNTNKIKYFKAALGDEKYSDLLKPIIILGYETNMNEPIYFYSWRPIAKQFYTWQVVSGCTSPPSYFPPVKFQSIDGKKEYTVMDGAVFANNPAIIALTHVLANFPKQHYILVSIGSGKLRPDLESTSIRHWGMMQWLRYILNLMLSSQSTDIAHSIYYLKARMIIPELQYYRFNIELPPKYYLLDNVNPNNIAALKKYGQEVVNQNKPELDALAAELSNDSVEPTQPVSADEPKLEKGLS